MRRCYLGTALVLGGLLLTGVTPTGSCGIGTLTVYAAEDTFSGELVEAIQNEVVTEQKYPQRKLQSRWSWKRHRKL